MLMTKEEDVEMKTLHSGAPLRHLRSVFLASALAALVGALSLSPAARADGLAEAKADVEKAMQKPVFVAPGAPFDMSKLKGKHVWIITSTMAVPFVATIGHGVEAAAKVAGLETTLFDGKGDVSEWNRGMAQAVAQHADGIVTVGASPELMKGPTGDASKANIPVVDAVTADKTALLVHRTFAELFPSFDVRGLLPCDVHRNERIEIEVSIDADGAGGLLGDRLTSVHGALPVAGRTHSYDGQTSFRRIWATMRSGV